MRRKEFEKSAAVPDGSKLRVGIALTRYNEDVTGALYEGAAALLRRAGVKEKNIFVMKSYGSFELPLSTQRLIKRHKLDAVIAIGCIVKGETSHDQHIANAVFNGLTRVSLDTGTPVGLAVLTVNTLAQAKARSRGGYNHGEKAALAAIEAATA